MRLRKSQIAKRRVMVWYLLGFVAVQVGLAVAAEVRYAIRDPEFDEMRQIVEQRRAEAPGRPLVLLIGSSRTKADLNAELLNHPEDPGAPVVVNASAAGAGPMLHEISLRRWLRAGIHPDLIFLEVMPMILSAREGAPVEENKNSERYCAAEIAHVLRYCAEPHRLCWRWARARGMPCNEHRVELREALHIDVRADGKIVRPSGRDDFGWAAGPGSIAPDEMQRRIQNDLEYYQSALTQPAVAPGALRALRAFIHLCRKEHIAVVLVAPPESSVFRSYCPAAAASQMRAVHALADELGVKLLDHRDWIDDAGFWDGHHATRQGADQYTQRFAREVFEPLAARIRYPAGTLASGGR